MKRILIILLLPAQLIMAQNEISLDECYKMARANHPNIKNTETWHLITSLRQENIKTGYLPQVSINGQATYQSDVTSIDIPIPDISIPTVSKDQYKAYAELKQTIWDGGLTKANSRLEEAILKNNLSNLEVELYRLKDDVSRAFFTVINMEKQKEVLDAQMEILNKKLNTIQSGIENMVIEKSAALSLQAEILSLEQKMIQLETVRKTSLKILSILTGQNIPDNSRLKYHNQHIKMEKNIHRPENQLFTNQISQLETQINLLDKSRNPKIFGFGQAGYGKPGLNMLNDKFDGYYLLGIGLSWNAFDWQKTKRQEKVLTLQQDMIKRQEHNFNRNILILLNQQKEQISKIEKQLETDKKIIDIKTEILKTYSSKLENGVINSSDYITELQSETIARLNQQQHLIQLSEAKEKYKLIQGTINVKN